MRSHSTSRWSPTTLGYWLVPAALIALAILWVASSPASAQTADSGASSAFDLDIDVNLLGVGTANVGPIGSSDGAGPPDYSDPDSALSADLSVAGVLTGSTGLLETNATGTDLGTANGSTAAEATVDGLSLGIVGDLLSLTADTIGSTASVSGPCADEVDLSTNGSAVLENAALSLDLLGVFTGDVTIPVNPVPNDVVLDVNVLAGSAFVILNEQIVSPPSDTSGSITVNAIRISLDVLGLVTADIIISQSQAEMTCDLTPSANLVVEKSADPTPATVDENLTYTINVTNEGPADATNVVVTDTLPAGVDLVSVDPDADCEEMAFPVITCDFATIGAGDGVAITIVVTPTEPGFITNTATATSEVEDPCPECAEDEIETFVGPPPGEPFACTTTAFLSQGAPANLYEVDVVSGDSTIVAPGFYPFNINGIGYNPVDNHIYGWINGDTEANHGIGRVDANYDVVNLGFPSNWDDFAFLTLGHHIGDFDNNGHLWLSSGVGTYWAQIDLAPGSATYMEILGAGEFGAPPTAGFAFADWGFNPSDGLFYISAASGNDVELWSFNPADGSLSFEADLGSHVNGPTGGAVYTDADNNLFTSNNSSGEIWRIQLPDGPASFLADGPAAGQNDGAICFNVVIPLGPEIEIEKTADTDEALGAGETVTYTVTVTNVGISAAADVLVEDELPEGIASGTWTCAGDACPAASGDMPLSETIDVLLVDESVEFTITALVDDDPPDVIVNIATASGPGVACADGFAPPCEGIVTNPALPIVTVDKEADTDEAGAGDTIEYEIIVRNIGQADIPVGETVDVSDPGAAGLESGSWTCSASGGAACPNASGDLPLAESIDTLPPDSEIVYTITATVADDAQGEIQNVVIVDGPIMCRVNPITAPPCEDTSTVIVTPPDGPIGPPPVDPIFPTPTPPADVEDDDEAVTPPAPPVAAPVAPAPAPPVAAPPADADADTDAAPAPADTGHGPWTDGPGGPSALVAGMAGTALALLAAAGAALAFRRRMLTP